MAKALAVAESKPFLAVNHMEGHLLSPFMAGNGPPRRSVALIVSGGHTMLVQVRRVGDYRLLGRTRDDAAGEALYKVAKKIGLPNPGGPENDNQAREGNPRAYTFPRSFMDGQSLEFSFSGLKTAVLYELPKLDLENPTVLAELKAILATHPEAKPQLKAQKTDAKTTKTKSTPKDRAAAFKKRDTNNDNKLTLEEFLVNQPDPEAAPKRFPTFDANKDGTLSEQEYVKSGKINGSN
jgi:tRNA A37 threonylcarbamoyltransferase TsaD